VREYVSEFVDSFKIAETIQLGQIVLIKMLSAAPNVFSETIGTQSRWGSVTHCDVLPENVKLRVSIDVRTLG